MYAPDTWVYRIIEVIDKPVRYIEDLCGDHCPCSRQRSDPRSHAPKQDVKKLCGAHCLCKRQCADRGRDPNDYLYADKQLELVDYLINSAVAEAVEKGKSAKEANEAYKERALHEAVHSNNVNVVSHLLANHGVVVSGEYGEVLMKIATKANCICIMDLLHKAEEKIF